MAECSETLIISKGNIEGCTEFRLLGLCVTFEVTDPERTRNIWSDWPRKTEAMNCMGKTNVTGADGTCPVFCILLSNGYIYIYIYICIYVYIYIYIYVYIAEKDAVHVWIGEIIFPMDNIFYFHVCRNLVSLPKYIVVYIWLKIRASIH